MEGRKRITPKPCEGGSLAAVSLWRFNAVLAFLAPFEYLLPRIVQKAISYQM